MNNRTLRDKSNAFRYCLINSFLLQFCALTATVLIVTAAASFAQTATWRYVATLPGGVKSYLNDEVKALPGKNNVRWEKMIKPDGSSATALVEWNCPDKLRLTKQITFYNADGSVIGTKKNGFDRTPIIPGSSADFLYRRICSTVSRQTANITALQADLRAFPDSGAPITRIAKRGDKFEVVPESGAGGWFNVVDSETQADYWMTGDSFKTADPAATAIKEASTKVKAKGKGVSLSKPPRRPNRPDKSKSQQ